MGDLNLNPRNDSDMERINQLCNGKLEMALREHTTTDSKNQIDHILADKVLKSRIFVTSYYNFATNHKLLVARIGVSENKLSRETVKQLKYPSTKFMKENMENIAEKESTPSFYFEERGGRSENCEHTISDDEESRN